MRLKSWGSTCPSKNQTTYILMEHNEGKIMRWHLSFKEPDHVHPNGTQWGQNCEVALVLQRARPRTFWWHTKRPKSWGGTCLSKSETTYMLMAHEEAEIVRWRLSFKERDHVLSDGTRRGQNREVVLVFQRARPRTPWWHTQRPKSWGGACPSKSKTTYSLMAHEEAKIVRWHLSFKEVDHLLPDGTRRGRNREVALVIQRARPRTSWWHTKRPKSWGGACPSKSETTYCLMAYEEAEIVRWHLSVKERDHVLPYQRKRTWMSVSLSKGLDSNVLIHSQRETWNAEVMWDACFKAYLEIGLTLCQLRE
jgi:hypothetical protein